MGRLREALLDEARPLFERYRAMFALRNVGGEEAALALAEGELGSQPWGPGWSLLQPEGPLWPRGASQVPPHILATCPACY